MLATLDDPISLFLEVDQAGQVPITLLPPRELRRRVQEHNAMLEAAQSASPAAGRSDPLTLPAVVPVQPHLLTSVTPLPLAAFERVHQTGTFLYQSLVNRRILAPAVGEGWSVINHADLAATLPELSPASSLRRVRYLVQMRRDNDGRIKAIRIHSTTYKPIVERRFVYPESRRD